MATGTVHSIYPEDATLLAPQRAFLKANVKGRMLTGPEARPKYDAMVAERPAPLPDTSYTADSVGGVPGFWCRPAKAAPGTDTAAILFLHGGGFVVGSATAFHGYASHLVQRTGIAVFVAEYRLAPEHPFPAALDDSTAALRGLEALGYARVGVVGSSAGGALAVGALVEKAPAIVRAALLISPVTDLAMTGASFTTRAEDEPTLTPANVAHLYDLYLNGHDPRDPRASPLYADLSSLPPLQLHVGRDEILLDDSVMLAERAKAAGVDTQLHVWEGMAHVFPGNVNQLKAATEAMDMSGTFLSAHLL